VKQLLTNPANFVKIAQRIRPSGAFIFQNVAKQFQSGGLTTHTCTNGGEIWSGWVDPAAFTPRDEEMNMTSLSASQPVWLIASWLLLIFTVAGRTIGELNFCVGELACRRANPYTLSFTQNRELSRPSAWYATPM